MLFPFRPTVTEHYRGLVHFDPALCTRLRHLQDALHRQGDRVQGAARASSPGVTSPASAPFADDAWKAARNTRSARIQRARRSILTIGELKKSYTVARKPPAKTPRRLRLRRGNQDANPSRRHTLTLLESIPEKAGKRRGVD